MQYKRTDQASGRDGWTFYTLPETKRIEQLIIGSALCEMEEHKAYWHPTGDVNIRRQKNLSIY